MRYWLLDPSPYAFGEEYGHYAGKGGVSYVSNWQITWPSPATKVSKIKKHSSTIFVTEGADAINHDGHSAPDRLRYRHPNSGKDRVSASDEQISSGLNISFLDGHVDNWSGRTLTVKPADKVAGNERWAMWYPAAQ